MGYIEYNPNPIARHVGDCAVRAIAKALDIGWEQAYMTLMVNGYKMGDMPSANNVWGAVLRQNGFYRAALPDTCPDCYTVADFCEDHPVGVFVIACTGHVVTAVNGDIYDTWDSTRESPSYYWYKEE